MQALIQRWAMNGWTVKNIAQFSHSEGQLGELGLQHSGYSTIVFEKEDSSFCTVCNIAVNDLNRHRQWHANRESGRLLWDPDIDNPYPVSFQTKTGIILGACFISDISALK